MENVGEATVTTDEDVEDEATVTTDEDVEIVSCACGHHSIFVWLCLAVAYTHEAHIYQHHAGDQ